VDLEDLFHAHIGGMDTFARALLIADRIREETDLLEMRARRYASFDDGDGAKFAAGELGLAELRDLAVELGEPEPRSGRQEYLENLINRYL
jgi:xylose isomerase